MKKFFVAFVVFVIAFSCTVSAMDISYIQNSSFEDRTAGYTFKNGIAKVWRLGETAIVNNYGKIVIDYSPAEKEICANGLIAICGENNKIGFFDSEGKQITDYIYDSFTDVHEKTGAVTVGYIATMYLRDGDGSSDLIPVSKNGKFGYINSYGTVVIPFKYEYAYGFCGGMARICAEGELSDYGTYTNGKYGFLREDGTEILPPDSYWVATDFDVSLGYATAYNGTSDMVLIDRWGNIAKNNSSERSLLDIKYVVVNPQEYYYGVEDKYGNTVIPVEKTEPIIVKGDCFVVNNTLRNNRNEIIYSSDNIRIVDMYAPGLLRVTVFNDDRSIKGTGCIDVNGNVIVEPVYEYVRYLGDGLLSVETGSEYFIVDCNGRLLWSMKDKPVTAYNGFIIVNNQNTLISQIMINSIKRPLVYLNGENVIFTDAYPILENDRTMIPARTVFEKAGAEVEWNQEDSSVTVKKGLLSVRMKIGDKKIVIGDKVYETDVAPIIINNRTYIPLRVFSEGIGMNVRWDAENYTVYVD